MHDTLRKMHAGHRGMGTVLGRFQLYEIVGQVMFAGHRGRVYQQIVALSGTRPGDSVLDVGSNSGYLARKLSDAAAPAGRVTALDPSESAIAWARRHARPGMAFLVGTAQDMDLPDSSFDVVTCTLAVHHIPASKRQAAFSEMYRVTRPGGRLLVADFSTSRQPLPLHPGARRMRHAAAPDGALEGLAAAAGYRVESSGDLPLLHYITAVRPEGDPLD